MNENFKPYVPADKVTPEFTATSIVLVAILAVIGVDSVLDLSGVLDTGMIGGLVTIIIMIAIVYKAAMPKKNEK